MEYLNRSCSALHDPIHIEGDKKDVQIEVAIQYNDTFKEKLYSFANNINTIEKQVTHQNFRELPLLSLFRLLNPLPLFPKLFFR